MKLRAGIVSLDPRSGSSFKAALKKAARAEGRLLSAAQWRIPAEYMKARVQHLVPLSRQALELLLRLRKISGDGEPVFPSLRDPSRSLHGAALGGALRSLGFESREVTPHGFRSTACTLLNELGWRTEAIERQMAHRCVRLCPPTLQLCATPSRTPPHDASVGGLPGRVAHIRLDWHGHPTPELSGGPVPAHKRTPGCWSHRQCGAQILSNLISVERRLKLF